MFAIAVKTKSFNDNFEFLNSELSKGWINNQHGFMVIKDKSEGELRKLASVLFRHFGLESRVFEI